MSSNGTGLKPHPLTHEQWLDYVDGTAPRRMVEEVERHLRDCAECQDVKNRLTLARETLRTAAAADRSPQPESGQSSARVWDALRFRIRRSADLMEAPKVDFPQLRSILVSMCGEAGAEGALHRASGQDAAFAKNLGSIVEVMCGTKAARFVEHAAQSVRKDQVA